MTCLTRDTLHVTRYTTFISALVAGGCATSPQRYLPSYAQPAVAPAPVALHGSYHEVQRGETIWRIARAYGLEVGTLTAANQLRDPRALEVGQRLFIPLPKESGRFLWPLQGSLRRSAGSSGLEIAAPPQSVVRASRGGQVAVAARHVLGLGKTVVVDHQDGYVSVYAGLGQLLVGPGTFIRQGMPLGSLGSWPLRFEIRQGARPVKTLALLPTI